MFSSCLFLTSDPTILVSLTQIIVREGKNKQNILHTLYFCSVCASGETIYQISFSSLLFSLNKHQQPKVPSIEIITLLLFLLHYCHIPAPYAWIPSLEDALPRRQQHYFEQWIGEAFLEKMRKVGGKVMCFFCYLFCKCCCVLLGCCQEKKRDIYFIMGIGDAKAPQAGSKEHE